MSVAEKWAALSTGAPPQTGDGDYSVQQTLPSAGRQTPLTSSISVMCCIRLPMLQYPKDHFVMLTFLFRRFVLVERFLLASRLPSVFLSAPLWS